MNRIFRDRVEAGRLLARQLERLAGRPDALVLALPRGGVPVGFEVAHALRLPLDVLIVRKLGVPGHQELAMGAIASGETVFRNESVIASFQVTLREMQLVIARETAELRRREQMYRGERPPVRLEGKTVIVVDDGIATGATMRAAVRALAAGRPAAVVVAAPVIAADTVRELAQEADEVVAVMTPDDLMAIGQYYADFRQTTDDEVRALLGRCTTEHGCPEPRKTKARPRTAPGRAVKRAVRVPSRWAWHFRTLIALRDHLLTGRGERMREPCDAMEPPSLHGADAMDELYDRDLARALTANPDEALEEIDAAIQRIEKGTYGICEATGRAIARDALRARPWRRFAPENPAPATGRKKPDKSHAITKKPTPLGRR